MDYVENSQLDTDGTLLDFGCMDGFYHDVSEQKIDSCLKPALRARVSAVAKRSSALGAERGKCGVGKDK